MITYKCDRCGKEQVDKKTRGVTSPNSEKWFDLCEECANKYDLIIKVWWDETHAKMGEWLSRKV